MSLLTLQSVSLAVDDRELFRDVSLIVGEEDRIGLIGPNGSGKSTLLRVIAGLQQPDRGERTTRRDLRISFLEQAPAFDEGATVADAIRSGFEGRDAVRRELDEVHTALATADAPDEIERLLERQSRLETRLEELGGHDVEHRIEAVARHLGLPDLGARCDSLSGGEQRRVALARILLRPGDLLVLDEPTNHLDAEIIEWLEQRLLALKTPFLLVTHDRYFLDRLVTRTIEIEQATLHEYEGGYTEFLHARAARLAQERAAESTRLNLLRRETEWMRRGPPARTTKAKARIERYAALVDAAPEAADRELAFRIPPGPRLGERVIELDSVTAGYGDVPVIRDLSIEIGARTRVGIVGPNGAGKSTFLRVCMQQLEPAAGQVTVGSTVRFASIDQARSDLDPEKTVLQEVAGDNDYVSIDGRAVRVETFLEQFLFPGPMRRAKIGTLSGGEKNRVLLAKLLGAGGNVLVLDEPTNDLDLMTLRVLEEALNDFPGVVLVVSHDRYFLDRVATRVIRFDGAGHHRVHEGDLSGLLDKLEAERRAAEDAAARTAPQPKPAKPRGTASNDRPRKLSTRERAELEALPDDIATAEGELEAIDAELASADVWTGDGARGHDLTARREDAQRRVDELYRRWEELETIREASTTA